MENLEHIQFLLDEIVFDEGEADYLDMEQAVEEFLKIDAPRSVVPLLFRWFEKNRDKELGTPGPFVHFIEKELDYLPELISSLERLPSSHVLWMANRIANSEIEPERINYWIRVFEEVIKHPLTKDSSKEQAQSFIEHQAKRLDI
jgi:hypothetical protein